MLMTYTTGEFPRTYTPTVFDTHESAVEFEGVMVNLGLWDTAGREDYARLRPLSYPETSVFLITYHSPYAIHNIEANWLPEVRHHMPGTPIIAVRTKIDLDGKDLDEKQLALMAEGEERLRDLGLPIMRCSSLTQEGLKDVFNAAIKTALLQPEKPSEKRSLFRKIFRILH